MKKLIIVVFFVLLTVWIAPNFSVYATPNDVTLNEANIILAKINNVKLTRDQIEVFCRQAFLQKARGENNEELLKEIKFEKTKVNIMRKELIKEIKLPNITTEYKENALVLINILDYFKIAYEELEEYININDNNKNYKNIDNINYDIITGSTILEWRENLINSQKKLL